MTDIGIFTGHGDIGDVGVPGGVEHDEPSGYRVSGSGANMWFGADAFHFAWTRVSGDVELSAAVAFEGAGADPHRKAVIAVRAGLEDDAVYADVALHGDGLTSLQFRTERGADTKEVQSHRGGAARIGLRRRGRFVHAVLDGEPAGGAVRLDLPDEFLIGIGVCSHVRDASETAVFRDVELSGVEDAAPRLWSTVETIDIASTDRRSVTTVDRWIEAPNWTADDRLIVNGEGSLFGLPISGGALSRIDTGSATACNNDHGLSPDGTRMAISDQSAADGLSVIATLPIGGGTPTRITPNAPSYWHGWSPDGSTLAYCAARDGVYGIFTIPAGGGEERRLTTAVHLDDGPDYSPDGRWIYFNSDRTGRMQIHRVPAEGGEIEHVVHSPTADWFPHVSPDGRWMVHLAYAPEVDGHPRDHDVALVLTDRHDGTGRVIAELFGGQGTINVPSWSPDSTRFAFVSYAYL